MAGWVKQHRKIMDSDIWSSDALFKTFAWCVMKAAHKPQTVGFETGGSIDLVKIKRGQFVFGRNTAAKELQHKATSVWKRIKRLEELGNISIISNKRYSIITVVNYDLYQATEAFEEQPSATKKTAKKKPRKPNDIIGKHICKVFNIEPVTKNELSRICRVASDLRLKKATPESIDFRCINYRKQWPKSKLTPEALLKHWDQLDNGQTKPKFKPPENAAQMITHWRRTNKGIFEGHSLQNRTLEAINGDVVSDGVIIITGERITKMKNEWRIKNA